LLGLTTQEAHTTEYCR